MNRRDADLVKMLDVMSEYVDTSTFDRSRPESWMDMFLMGDLKIHPDQYDDFIEDISHQFEIESSQSRYVDDADTLFTRIQRRWNPKWQVKPPDISVREILLIAQSGRWPLEYEVKLR